MIVKQFLSYDALEPKDY